MLLDPLPADRVERRALIFHEAWHARQAALGLPANTVVAGHLDDPISRYLIRMEWAALKAALESSGASRARHIAQALGFRQRRIGNDVEARAAEREQMRHEGLAAYTGVKLSGDAQRLAIMELGRGAAKPSLGRSFSYISGPAWGLVLDEVSRGWRRKLGGGKDLPDLIPFGAAKTSRADDYGGTQILIEETLAGAKRRASLAAALASTAEARALRLPLGRMSMNFDPNRVTTAPDGSTLYEKITLSDQWGKIAVDGTSLRLAPDFTAAFAAWPLGSSAKLELMPGWTVETRAEGGARVVPPAK